MFWEDLISVGIIIDRTSFDGLWLYMKLYESSLTMKAKVSTHLVWEIEGEECDEEYIRDGLDKVRMDAEEDGSYYRKLEG